MKSPWSCAAVALLCLAPATRAAPTPKALAKTYEVPYRLTVPKHVLVRAKINGKGPYNFILDTGAPALFIAESLGKKLGLSPDRGWAVVDRFEVEGGVVMPKVKARVETPFQLEGMNGMGLAGAELHGIIGYNVLARFRMDIDFTRDKMTWTALDFEPRGPLGLGSRVGGAGGLEIIGSVMKMLGSLLGRKTNPEVLPRGFLGIELKDTDDGPVVGTVLADGPAGTAGVRAGDRITKFAGRTVVDSGDLRRFVGKLAAGAAVTLTVVRDGHTRDIAFKAGEGF
jgi:hypothetical protein